ncbi:SIS domain-containing protein, partial [Bacteroidota bacterium]
LAIQTIQSESQSINKLSELIDDDFYYAVKKIFDSKGRVIITGIGKSANIGRKIVATLNSTGTPSIFMHAADAIHGDLGTIQDEDIVICISKSGDTPEIKVLVPLIQKLNNFIIAMVSNTDSYLAIQADLILKATVEKEACPWNLAPTSSTTAQLVIGDALAICLLEFRGFSNDDFARLHPGGSLGKQLYLRVCDLYTHVNAPKVNLTESVKNVILEISSKMLGATAVLNNSGEIMGIITDGDLRRMLEENDSIDKLTASKIMSKNPKCIEKNALAVNALSMMRNNNITQLLVVENDKYSGIIHIHNILKEGIV